MENSLNRITEQAGKVTASCVAADDRHSVLSFDGAPLVLRVLSVKADGKMQPLSCLGGDVTILGGDVILVSDPSKQLEICPGPLDEEAVVDIEMEIYPMTDAAVVMKAVSGAVLKERQEAADHYGALHTAYEGALRRIRQDEDLLEMRSSAASELSQTKIMKLYRNIRKRRHQADPFAYLRPEMDREDSEILCNVDAVIYGRHRFEICGWVYNPVYNREKLTFRNASGDVVPATIQRMERRDVARLLGLDCHTLLAFRAHFEYQKVGTVPLVLEVEDPRGYIVCPVDKLDADMIEKGSKGVLEKVLPLRINHMEDYDDCYQSFRATKEEVEKQRQVHFAYEPKLSICIPLYNTPAPFLKEIMDSLLGQSYSNIQLCLADGSPGEEVGQFIKNNYGADSRVVYKHLTENRGISANTNEAFALADGEFIMLSDHDDIVEPNACFEIVKAINEGNGVDVVYTDEDKVSLDGSYFSEPNFKPDYNLEYLRSCNYITHIFCVRRSIVEEIGGEQSVYDGAQDYAFILHCCEKARSVAHVSQSLYHWRTHPASTAGNPESKMYAYHNGAAALQAHYDRLGIKANVTSDYEHLGFYNTKFMIEGDPSVAVIIDEGADKELASVTEESVENMTGGFRVSTLHASYEALADRADAINEAAQRADGDYLVFLKAGTVVKNKQWLEKLMGYCQLPGVACSAAKICTSDNRVWQCGQVIGLNGAADAMFRGFRADSDLYAGRGFSAYNVSAAELSGLMVKKELYLSVQGLSKEPEGALADADLCLKLGKAGYRHVVNGKLRLSLSQTLNQLTESAGQLSSDGKKAFCEKWQDVIASGDPCYNRNLTLDGSGFYVEYENPDEE